MYAAINKCARNGGIFLPIFLLLSGCSTLSIDKRTYVDGKQVIAREKKVEVQILRWDITYVNSKEFTVWDVLYVNNNKVPRCVGTVWETMDLTISIPEQLVYVNKQTSLFVGQFTEKPWEFGNLTIMVEGSGIVKKFYVIPPYKNRKDCLYPKGKIL